MTQLTMKQAFAFHKTTGRMISIAEAQNGLHCDCVCTHCNSLLVAKQGAERSWHFAHHSGADCDGAAESALHRAAKQIITDRSGMILPSFVVSAVEEASHGRRAEHLIEVEPFFADLSCIRQEVPLMVISDSEVGYGGRLIRPDLVAAIGNTDLIVEVAVTHFVDFDKCDLIERLGLAAVEVTVDPELHENWDWDCLTKVVIDGQSNKEWIFYPAEKELQKQATEEALRKAAALPIPEKNGDAITAQKRSKKPYTEKVFYARNRKVFLRDYSSYLTVWFPYDEALNSIIKMLGGRWNDRYGNWNVPTWLRDRVEDALKTYSPKF